MGVEEDGKKKKKSKLKWNKNKKKMSEIEKKKPVYFCRGVHFVAIIKALSSPTSPCLDDDGPRIKNRPPN